MQPNGLLDELRWRALLFQQTEGVSALLSSGSIAGYVGFDPTAASLHVGNLVPVMGLVHLQRHGHRPIVLVGGGTGMIGDPSGKASERVLLTPERVAENTRAIAKQLGRFMEMDGPNAAKLVDNAEWLGRLGAIEFMRDVGKHFTVNVMLQKESVRSRMETGISYTEFSYMLLQAYDYLELHRRHGARLQLGGSDQWGNITAGIELIRRADGGDAHGLTFPLVTTAAGTKFGKSESGAVYLDPELTTAYAFYQFWVNADDRDVGRWLRYFTVMPRAEIEELDRETEEHPERRTAQVALARDVTARVHGPEGVAIAERVTKFNFGGLDPRELGESELAIMRRESPFAEVREADVAAEGTAGAFDVVKLVTACGLVDSNGAARRLLQQGGVSINKRKLGADERSVPASEALLAGGHVIVGKGRRDYGLVRVR